MRLGLRAKALIASIGLVAVPAVVAYVYARGEIEQATVTAVESDLRQRVALGLETRSGWPSIDAGSDVWQPVAERLARASATRVSIIRLDGTVVGDSAVPTKQLAQVGNHRLRPEVQEALNHGIGIERRRSQTVENDLLYLAMPFGEPGQATGVLRMALELRAVDREVSALQGRVGVGALLAMLLAAMAAALSVSWVSRGTRELIAVAKRMSDGDLESPVPEVGHADQAELSRTLEQLARRLSSTLSDLRSERDWMGGILSRMREGVILLDADQRIVMMNPALRDMLLLNDDAIGKPLLEMIRHSGLMKLLDQALVKGQPQSSEIEVGGLKPRLLLVRASPLGSERSVFAVFLDVTEMRRLESLRKDFVANVSHELRTPVAAIRSAAETIRDVALNDTKSLPLFVDIIARHSERLGSLVDDLLELSRIESREIKVVMQSVDLGAVVEQTLGLFEERAGRAAQTLELVMPEGLPFVLADARAIDRVLLNLIENAVKYSGNGAVVRVVVKRQGQQVRVCVEDTGPGIAEEHLPRLFERFYRVDNGRSREQGGTGLGLSIVKHLIDAMGGEISVESTLGVGTRFSFALPVA